MFRCLRNGQIVSKVETVVGEGGRRGIYDSSEQAVAVGKDAPKP